MKTLALALVSCSLLTLSTTSPAQISSLPTEPAGIAYRYFPRQFVQWVGPELPYSMIDLEVDDRGDKPLYDAVLTDRASNKRVHYTNLQSEVDIDKAAGAEVHLVPMQFDSPAEAAKGATYLLRFATETGVPVTWQFIQGSDVGEQGGGMNPISGPVPILLYREQGAVAGEGTALKVGNVTSTADMWKEISQPPYFIAYHGALSTGVHTLAFVSRVIEWKAEPPVSAVAPSAEWKLTSEDGRVLTTHVESFAHGVALLHETHPALGTVVSVQTRQTPNGWALEQLRYSPVGAKKGEHTLTFTFTPGDGGASKFELLAGRKTHLASGDLVMSAGGESWTVTQPTWAHKAPVEARVAFKTEAPAATATSTPTSTPMSMPVSTGGAATH